MAAGSLLALIDDIATVLDDVAAMSKVAAKKTTGVLGDDLALNAQQVSGIRAERELPVVWAVTKGSLLNKLFLVPAALLISAFMPQAIIWLLMIGGAYLCLEGVEKLVHKYLHSDEDNHKELQQALTGNTDMVAFEKDKIKGAIRTDFILSAEIIVISLGSMSEAALPTQIIALSILALLFTFGVYGIVAAIVKLDDVGLWMVENSRGRLATLQRLSGQFLLNLAPRLMKFLTVIGTLAMFLVGGGILAHHSMPIEHMVEQMTQSGEYLGIPAAGTMVSMLANLITGVVAGTLILIPVTLFQKLRKK